MRLADRRLVRGAIGISKSMLGMGVAPPNVQKKRMELCQECPKAVRCAPHAPPVCFCKACGCYLKHKTRLKSERCPMGKW